jgi:addiction module HigA family antidote
MMQMKNPAHPGVVIRFALDDLGISVAAAARALGVTRQQLYNVISGRSRITAEMAMRLEKGLGSTADTWLRMQTNYDLAEVRNRSEALNVTPIAPRFAAQ